jgi:hypothetical protein
MQQNFITGYENKSYTTEDQQVFWDNNYKPVKIAASPYTQEVNTFFNSLDKKNVTQTKDYWRTITPTNDSEVFQRWLFAFMSVHTSWKANVKGYEAIKDWWEWLNRWGNLNDILQVSRVGMHNNRVKYISLFSKYFWKNPGEFQKKKNETWTAFRNRLEKNTLGLGLAKTSFAIELCYPNEAKVVCLDTHMFKAYKLDQIKHVKLYTQIEEHWVAMASMWNCPSYVARCIYWDNKQKQTDSRYWSYILEK